MCGIIGQVNQKQSIPEDRFNTARDTLKHRGPDGFGSVFFQHKTVALGHRRLSIIDLSDKGKQPMSNEDASIWVTCNGEIYNYLTLRKILEKAGHRFRSSSDMEVLVHGYEEWGRDLPNYLKGMFAFGIWDDNKKEMFLARDRFGIKPLYYFAGNDRFVFASELKAILADPAIPRRLNAQAAADFFVYRFIPSPNSIWRDIYKLPPAHSLLLKADGRFEIQTYWQIETANKEIPVKEAVEKIADLLSNAVEEHLLSDVPVGLFLSGGFDSTTLAWILARQGQQLDSFTIGFKNWILSEHEDAQLAAKSFGTKPNTYFVDAPIVEKLDQLAYYYDEPLGGTSFLPTFELARLASQKVKVVLAGDGGDEVFAGYNWHKSYFTPWYKQPKRALQKVLAASNGLSDHYHQAMNWTNWSYQDLHQLFVPGFGAFSHREDYFLNPGSLVNSDLKSLQLLDYRYFLPEVVLHKVDRASMAHGLEVRVPFLDHELTSYVMQLSTKLYFRHNRNKHLLFELVKPHFPKALLQKPKKGFGMSVRHFFKLDYFPPNWQNSSVFVDQVLNPKFVQILINQKAYKKLWAIFIFMTWYEQWKP